jgi:hypothetical protein
VRIYDLVKTEGSENSTQGDRIFQQAQTILITAAESRPKSNHRFTLMNAEARWSAPNTGGKHVIVVVVPQAPLKSVKFVQSVVKFDSCSIFGSDALFN